MNVKTECVPACIFVTEIEIASLFSKTVHLGFLGTDFAAPGFCSPRGCQGSRFYRGVRIDVLYYSINERRACEIRLLQRVLEALLFSLGYSVYYL